MKKNIPSSENTPSNPWLGVSLLLIGVIAGYAVSSGALESGGTGAMKVAQIANPPPARAPTPTPSPTPTPNPTPPPPTADGDVPPVDASDHVRGNPDALISIVEYSDYECPFCKRIHGTHQALVDKYDGKVNWVYRHFPLGPHKNAMPTAIASECINDIGGNDAFWDFTDAIFADHGNWDFESYLPDLNISVSDFNDCFEAKKHQSEIQDEMDAASAIGVQGTPGNFILNNKTGESIDVSGAQPLDKFSEAIDSLLDSDAQAMAPSKKAGKPRDQMVHVMNSSFSQTTISFKQGENATITFMGMQGEHGISVPGLGINQAIPSGRNTTVTIPTDKPGTYDFFCNVECGAGHDSMKGQIIIL